MPKGRSSMKYIPQVICQNFRFFSLYGGNGNRRGRSSELIHELLVEGHNSVNPIRSGRQKGGTEMVRSWFLAKSGTRHDADAGSIEEAESVEFVGLAVGVFGGGDGLLRECDGGEEVHGALREKLEVSKRSVMLGDFMVKGGNLPLVLGI